MRKISTGVIIGLLLIGFALAGGIVTNTNQSADFIRLLNRNASTDIDATYFNPAGVMKLNDGLHFYLSSQTIDQGRTITSDVVTLQRKTFDGSVFVPSFPNAWLVYKMDKFALAGGFAPIGGGGGAEFKPGLPTFEVPVSFIPAGLTAAGIPTDRYSYDTYLKRTSVYYGYQATVSYKINDMISVGAGGRYVAVDNDTEGYIRDIMIDPESTALGADGSMVLASSFFTNAAGALTAGAAQATAGAAGAAQGAANLQQIIDAGGGSFTFDFLLGAGLITQEDFNLVAGGFAALGLPFDSSADTPIISQAAALAAATQFSGLAAQLTGQSAAFTAQGAATEDLELKNSKQTGNGFAPIVSLYLSPAEGLDIGIRYEGQVDLEITNDTEIDDTGLYPDGATVNADMPAQLALGVGYMVMPNLRLVADFNYYFNENVDWDGKEKFVENGTEIGFGADFAVSDALQLSAGFLLGSAGALDGYHSALDQTFDTQTFGAGGRYSVNDNLYISFGVSNTWYDLIENEGVEYSSGGSVLATGLETYDKDTINFAIGIGFSR